jgi:NADH-quinone oxidoreductase subunit L
MAGVFVLSPAAMFTVATVGAFTAILAATIALVQNDIKKVLAYSTVSQLGYMFLGVGVGAFTAGFFHVVTHAFFKACLFLGAGSVIYAMHVRIHDHDASQDMRNMGGLKKYMPYTFMTFAAAWAAIVGVPLTSGFVSKDEILLKAATSYIPSPREDNTVGVGAKQITLWEWPEWGGTFLYWVGAAAAVLTAFYMTRLFIGIFFGKFHGWKIKKRWQPEHHAHDHHHAHDPQHKLDGPKPVESPWQMTAPLIILGAGSLLLGLINAHVLHTHVVSDWLSPVFASASESVKLIEGHEAMDVTVLAVALAAFAGGSGFAYWLYVREAGAPARRWARQFPRLYQLVVDKWRVDEFYEETILGAVDSLAEFAAWFDRWVVDGILARVSAGIIAAAGMVLRLAQTGRVHAYGAAMAAGMAVVGWFLLTPHAEARVSENHSTGKYALTAAPGLGYSYRWVHSAKPETGAEPAKGSGEGEFSDAPELEFDLAVDEERKVTLEVKNSFGQVAAREFVFKRPKPDLSRAGPARRIEVERGEDGQLRGNVQEPARSPGARSHEESP